MSHPSDSLAQEHCYPTMFGQAEVFHLETDEGTPIRVLYVGGGFQSASYVGARRFEPVFAYYRGFDHLFEAIPHPKNVLMIGGGGFSYPKHLLTTQSDVCMDVVEIDPAIVDIARRHFFLDELERQCNAANKARLNIFVEDGVAHLGKREARSCDVIINDSFDGTNPTGLLMSKEALEQAKRCLTPGGIYLLNTVTDEDDEDQPESENSTGGTSAESLRIVSVAMDALSEVFANVYDIPCIDEEFAGADNHLLIASDTSYLFSGITAWLAK